MKLLLSTALALSLSSSNAVLPPGYEDEMWCPSGDCKIYSNPMGYSGALSSFYFCYNNSTDNVTDGVWTGSLTNVTVPEGWEEPEECTKEVYSECDYDSDCIPTVRTATPINDDDYVRFPPMCQCFADSTFHPFDQCEGRNATYCVEAVCPGDSCENFVGECIIQDNGAGACTLDWKHSRGDDDFVFTRRPTRRPTRKPTRKPSRKPSKPSNKPTDIPTELPTSPPTELPTPTPFLTSSPTPAPVLTLPPTSEPMTFPPTSEPILQTLPPTPAPSEGPTDMPVYISMPMEDMFDEKKNRMFVRGSKNNVATKSNHEYYNGYEQDFIEEEDYEFGRKYRVEAVA